MSISAEEESPKEGICLTRSPLCLTGNEGVSRSPPVLSTVLIHYLGFTQAYACFNAHKVALGSWTVEDTISDTIITRGCGNQREAISLVLFKGGRKRGALLPTPPSKPFRVLVPLVCSIPAYTGAMSSTRGSCSR